MFRQCWVSETPGRVLIKHTGWDLTPLGILINTSDFMLFLNAEDFVAHSWLRFTGPSLLIVVINFYGVLIMCQALKLSVLHILSFNPMTTWGSYYYYPGFPMRKLRLRMTKWLAFWTGFRVWALNHCLYCILNSKAPWRYLNKYGLCLCRAYFINRALFY